jgi:hypothetical protein
MKFLMSVLVYVVLAAFLAWGILLAVRGQYWLLIAASTTYLLGLGFIGCLPKKSH